MERDQARTVWIYRDYVRLFGGHVKHSHYFDHVRRMPGFAPRITFSAEPSNESQARERERLWPARHGVMAERWEPAGRDVLFLAGVDWRSQPVTIVGYKSPELARTLSERLHAANIEHLPVCEFLDRSAFLELLGES